MNLFVGDVNYKFLKIDDFFDLDEERFVIGRVIFKNRADINFFVIVI